VRALSMVRSGVSGPLHSQVLSVSSARRWQAVRTPEVEGRGLEDGDYVVNDNEIIDLLSSV